MVLHRRFSHNPNTRTIVTGDQVTHFGNVAAYHGLRSSVHFYPFSPVWKGGISGCGSSN